MTPSQIVQFVRDQTGIPSAEIPDSRMYQYLNYAYQQTWYKIVDIDKNYSWTKWTTNIVAGTNQYELKDVVNTPTPDFGQFKIERVEIKYEQAQQYPYVATAVDYNNLTESLDWYSRNQIKAQPIYIVSNESIFIYPTPTNNIANGLVLEGTLKPYDLTASMTQDDILVKPEWHNVLALGLFEYVYQERDLLDKKQFAKAEYEKETQRMLDSLANRILTPVKGLGNTFDAYTYQLNNFYYPYNR